MEILKPQSEKIGIVIYLYRYSRLSGDIIYEELADNLLDEIIYKINSDNPMNLQESLFTIGFGIEYLIRNHFVEGDADEILNELDCLAIMHIDKYRLRQIGLDNGIIGLGRYILARIAPREIPKNLRFQLLLKEYLIYLVDWLEDLLPQAEGSIGEILDFATELLEMGFYPSKVKKIIKYCLFTTEGGDYISKIKKLSI